jgi:hypothetical protein
MRKNGATDFSINRSDPATCHTPRRNTEIDTLLRQSEQLRSFCSAVASIASSAYRNGFSSLLPTSAVSPNSSVINDNVFMPVAIMLVLEEKPAAESSRSIGGGCGGAASPASLFSPEDFETIMGQQEMQAKFEQMTKVLPIEGIVTTAEAALVSQWLCVVCCGVCLHLERCGWGKSFSSSLSLSDVVAVVAPCTLTHRSSGLCTKPVRRQVVCAGYSVHVWRQYSHAAQAVEDMLMNQLIAAIGQHICPDDFAK